MVLDGSRGSLDGSKGSWRPPQRTENRDDQDKWYTAMETPLAKV